MRQRVLMILAALILMTGVDQAAAQQPALSCSVAQTAEWNRIVDTQDSVDGRDPRGDSIGDFRPAQRIIKVLKLKEHWVPVDGTKRTLCGQSFSGDLNDIIFTPNEKDWNNQIVPRAAFSYLVRHRKGKPRPPCTDQFHSGDNCIEAEITPSVPWLTQIRSNPRIRQGKSLCAYGPWVYDTGHGGGKPEIHPAEEIWWSERTSDGSTRHRLVLTQDNSARFEDARRFSGRPPATWNPWAGSPLPAVFRIAFAVTPGSEQLFAVVGSRRDLQLGVSTGNVPSMSEDWEPGSRLNRLTVDGKLLVAVEERQLVDSDIGVRFGGVCRRDDGRVQGFITLSTQVQRVGNVSGFHVLDVATSRSSLAASALALSTPPETAEGLLAERVTGAEASATLVPGTLRSTVVNDRRVLLGDLRIVARAAPGENLSPVRTQLSGLTAAAAPLGRERVLSHWTLGNAHGELTGVVRDVPFGNVEGVRVITRTEQIGLETEGVAVQASLQMDSVETAPGAGSFVVRPGDTPVVVSAQRVRSWSVRLVPWYAVVHNDETYPEEASDLADSLNQVLETRRADAVMRLFGSAQPFTVTWRISRVDPATGAVTEVPLAGPSASGVVARVDATDPILPRLVLAFDSAQTVSEYRIEVRIRDPFGTTDTAAVTAGTTAVRVDDSVEAALTQLVRNDTLVEGTTAWQRQLDVRDWIDVAIEDGWLTTSELDELQRRLAALLAAQQ